MYTYKAKVIKIIDGDTVDFDVDLGFHVMIRLRGVLNVDTPSHEETGGLESLLDEKKDQEGYVTIMTDKKDGVDIFSIKLL